MFSKDQVLNALKKVIHPEKGKDIVSLGMVSEISFNDSGISLTITPDKSNDPFISSIKIYFLLNRFFPCNASICWRSNELTVLFIKLDN